MRRILCMLAVALLLFAGCGSVPQKESGKIVCTQFSAYDWAVNITRGTDVEVILLTDNGVDIHSYQPTARDIVDIASADMFIYVGGSSEKWAEDILDTTALNTPALCLTDMVETVCHDDHHHEHEGHEHTFDEHVWLSVKKARELCGSISEELCRIFPEHSDVFKDNAAVYDVELQELDKGFAALGNGMALFVGKFPFIYLMNDYDIHYYAAFDGCSAESKASFSTIMNLAAVADEHSVRTGIIIKGDDREFFDTVSQNTSEGLDLVIMEPLQQVTRDEIEGGLSYASVMRDNLTALEIALRQD